jgi:hypothetical protein
MPSPDSAPGTQTSAAVFPSDNRQNRDPSILRRSTAEQLRDDIDHGRTCDKVDALDPAAAPLGADEEAAGTPLDQSDVEAARVIESSRSYQPGSDRRVGAAWLLIAFAFALGAVLIAWMVWLHG